MPQLLAEHHFVPAALLTRCRPQLILAAMCMFAAWLLLTFEIIDIDAAAVWVLIIAGVGAPWLLPVLLAYFRSIKKVCVYEEGISWTIRGREAFQPWEDLREVYRVERNLRSGGFQLEMTLLFKKKVQVVFDQTLANIFQLAALVEAIATQRLLPHYREQLEQGSAAFGPVVIKKEGLRIHERDFAWAEVESYAIDSGGLVIRPVNAEEPERFAEFATIPNYLVLLKLLEEKLDR
jgi:hypothetical protein